MLEEISISNLGVIKKAHLPLTSGLSVITGETGAGKSMILSSLHLLMGKRSDAGIVRHGAEHATAEGCWTLDNEELIKKIEETGAIIEDGQLFINRTVKSDGKSRAVLGGKSTPAKVLAEMGENLVSIHGQADQIRLKNPDAQLAALDKYASANLSAPLTTYGKTFKEWRKLKRTLEDLKTNEKAREREYNELVGFLEDFEELSPEEGEISTLEKEIDLLSNLDTLREGVTSVLALLAPEDYEATPIEGQLRYVLQVLSKIAVHDPELDVVLEKAQEALAQIEDVTSTLEDYRDTVDEDGIERLYAAQQRLTSLKAFMKKQRLTLEEIIDKAQVAEARMNEIDPEANSIEAIEEKVEAAHTKLVAQGAKVTKVRVTAALALQDAVNRELSGLAMGGSKLVIEFNASVFTARGADEVLFMLTTPGAPTPRPISRAASGGELSRIMLALEVVLADPKETPTFVFDEIDSGVGGATALEIGKRLSLLARDAQVIVVSHLPQIAAFAENHLYVLKESTSDNTEATVQQLDVKARRAEIARMLSGMGDSDSGQAHADELIALAEAHRASIA